MIAWLKGADITARAVLGLFVMAIVLCFVVAVMTTCSARGDARREAANTRAVTVDAAAKEKAAGERLSDTIAINIREKERSDATASLPDARPSDRRLARACVQLRQQGTREADLPAACRSGA